MLILIHFLGTSSVVPDAKGLLQLCSLLLYLRVEIAVDSLVHPGLVVVLCPPFLLRVAHYIRHSFQVPVLVMTNNY